MGNIIQEIIFKVSSDAEDLRNGVGQVDDKIKETNKNTGGLQNQFKKLLPALGVAAIIGGFKKIATASLQAADVQAKANQKLLVAANGRVDVQQKLIKQAADLQKVTTFGDEQTIEAQARLLPLLNGNSDAVQQLIPLIQDLSVFTGMDLASAADLVGKSVGSSTNALSRYGIQIEGAVGSSERLESAIASLNARAGGQAAAAARVGLGAWTQFKNLVGDLSEEFGFFLIKGLNPIIEGMKSLVSSAIDYVQSPLSETLEKERIEMNALVYSITDANTSQEDRIKLIKNLKSEYPNLLANMNAEEISNKDLALALEEANKQYLNKIVLQKQLEEKEKIQDGIAKQEINAAEQQIELRKELIKLNEEFNLGIDLGRGSLLGNAKQVLNELKNAEGVGFFTEGDLKKQIFYLEQTNSAVVSQKDNLQEVSETYEELSNELGLSFGLISKEDGQKSANNFVQGFTEGAKKEKEKLQELDLLDRSVFEVPVEDTEFRFDNVIKLAKDAFAQIEAIPLPDLLEDKFIGEKFEIIGQNMIEAFSMANDAINALPIGEKAQKEIERLDELIEKQKEAVDKAKIYAEEGGAEQLALEENRLSRLENLQKQEEQQKEQALKRSLAIQKSMALAEIAINLATTLSNIDKTSSALGPLGIPLKTTQTLQAIAQAAINTASVLSANASFYEGTEDTGRGGKLDSKGGFAAVLHPNERVMTAKQNKRIKQALGNVSNDDLVKMIENSKSLSINPNGLLVDSSAINEKMNTKMDEMISLNREMLKAMKRNGVNVNIDRNGLSVMMHQMVQRQNILNTL